MPALVSPPFTAPVPVGPRDENPVGVLAVLAAIALSGLGVGAAVAGRRRLKSIGQLQCAYDRPIVGVPLDYHGDWWTQRGRGLYQRAARETAWDQPGTDGVPDWHRPWVDRVAKRMIEIDLIDMTDGRAQNQTCLSQFPPDQDTDPRNVIFWENLVAHVENERTRPGTKPAGYREAGAPPFTG